MSKLRSILLLAAALAWQTTPSGASTVSDPTGDFVPGYTGSTAGAFDVASASATFDGTNFDLRVTLNGAIAASPTALYVFGINRGAGTARFAVNGVGGVFFDSVVTVDALGIGTVRDLIANTASPLAGSNVLINSNLLEILVPLALLPSEGFGPANYGFNVWPRDQSLPAGFGQISDFAPDNSSFTASVPEPSTWAMMILGFAGVGFLAYRKSRPALLAA